jgi:putative drug exporter of the RND superfamily
VSGRRGHGLLGLIARVSIARPRTVLIAALVLVALAAFAARDVSDHLTGLGSTDRSSESAAAAAALDRSGARSRPNLVVLARSGRPVDDPAVAARGRRLAGELAAERDVRWVTSYWDGRVPALRSRDGRRALIAARLGGTELAASKRAAEIAERFSGVRDGFEVRVGGEAAMADQAQRTIAQDLARAELIALPLTLLVLILVFGSAVAALLPLVVGVIAMVGTSALLRAASEVFDVSIFAQSLTTALALGLAIDYALFIVSRYREELRAGAAAPEAVTTTLQTAGRTVLFSAVAVGAALGSMLVFRLDFLRSFAIVGMSVAALAALAALVVVPAALLILGPRIDALDLRGLWRGRRRAPRTATPWERLTAAVIRFAPFVATATILVLVLFALPFMHARFGQIDDRQLPSSAQARVVGDQIREHFAGSVTGQIDIVTRGPAATAAALKAYTARIARLPGVVSVSGDGAGHLTVVSRFSDIATENQDLVREIRALPAPFGRLVGGVTAELVDSQRAIAARIVPALVIVVCTTLLLLVLMTGTVFVPIKALLLNALSLTAVFGALVWVFQEGHLSGLLGFTPLGYIDTTLPVLIFCIAFGVSMDYGVLLQSRIQEEYERTGDSRRAVEIGIHRSAGTITAAAAILVIVLLAVGTSRVMNIKMLGLGTALAVFIDATVIRCLLVPSLMTIAGRATWWSPRPVRTLHRRFGLSEVAPAPQPRENT